MPSKAKKKRSYPEAEELRIQIKEAALAYGFRRDVMGVREAKDQFSDVLQRALHGEEIVVTSDGRPLAMVVPYKPIPRGKPFRPDWELLRSIPMTSDSTADIRAERDSGF